MTCHPLRFKISSWRQLPQCKSNNSSELKISVTEFIQDPRLHGFRIRVDHSVFGTLFACILNPSGSLITRSPVTVEITPAQLLAELEKFGFIIEYNPEANLDGDQLTYLLTLHQLHFDKIRLMSVWHLENTAKVAEVYVVAFKVGQNPDWLNNGYSPSREEFRTALENGSAINISAISKAEKFNWSWLYGFVANIEDVVHDNAEVKLWE